MNNKIKNRPSATNTETVYISEDMRLKSKNIVSSSEAACNPEHLFMCWLLFLYLFLHKLNEEMIYYERKVCLWLRSRIH